jgi:hypothetical protein
VVLSESEEDDIVSERDEKDFVGGDDVIYVEDGALSEGEEGEEGEEEGDGESTFIEHAVSLLIALSSH